MYALPLTAGNIDRLYQCPVCLKTFVSDVYLTSHFDRRHPQNNLVFNDSMAIEVNPEYNSPQSEQVSELKNELKILKQELSEEREKNQALGRFDYAVNPGRRSIVVHTEDRKRQSSVFSRPQDGRKHTMNSADGRRVSIGSRSKGPKTRFKIGENEGEDSSQIDQMSNCDCGSRVTVVSRPDDRTSSLYGRDTRPGDRYSQNTRDRKSYSPSLNKPVIAPKKGKQAYVPSRQPSFIGANDPEWSTVNNSSHPWTILSDSGPKSTNRRTGAGDSSHITVKPCCSLAGNKPVKKLATNIHEKAVHTQEDGPPPLDWCPEPPPPAKPHLRQDCPRRVNHCLPRGPPNHLIKNCPLRQQAKQGTPAEVKMIEDGSGDAGLPPFPPSVPWYRQRRKPIAFFNMGELRRRRMETRYSREMVVKLSPHKPEPHSWKPLVFEVEPEPPPPPKDVGAKKKKKKKKKKKMKDLEEEDEEAPTRDKRTRRDKVDFDGDDEEMENADELDQNLVPDTGIQPSSTKLHHHRMQMQRGDEESSKSKRGQMKYSSNQPETQSEPFQYRGQERKSAAKQDQEQMPPPIQGAWQDRKSGQQSQATRGEEERPKMGRWQSMDKIQSPEQQRQPKTLQQSGRTRQSIGGQVDQTQTGQWGRPQQGQTPQPQSRQTQPEEWKQGQQPQAQQPKPQQRYQQQGWKSGQAPEVVAQQDPFAQQGQLPNPKGEAAQTPGKFTQQGRQQQPQPGNRKASVFGPRELEEEESSSPESEEGDDLVRRKEEKLLGHSKAGLFAGMPYISQPLADPDGDFNVNSAWGEGPDGWNSNWNAFVEDGGLYWGMTGILGQEREGRSKKNRWFGSKDSKNRKWKERRFLGAVPPWRGGSGGTVLTAESEIRQSKTSRGFRQFMDSISERRAAKAAANGN